jgi:Sec-independent protein translocase protein TatA
MREQVNGMMAEAREKMEQLRQGLKEFKKEMEEREVNNQGEKRQGRSYEGDDWEKMVEKVQCKTDIC